MIHEVTGDILLSGARTIAHGLSPNDHFSQGLALALRERWPAMYKDFRHFEKTHSPRSGTLWSWMGAGGKLIVSLFTQEPGVGHGEHSGRASLANVNHALKELRRFVETEQVTSLALPRLATGVGGLAWPDVQPLIEQHLGSLAIPVYVYSHYVPGRHALEPALAA